MAGGGCRFFRHSLSVVWVCTNPTQVSELLLRRQLILTIWIDNGENIEVVVIQESLREVVAGLVAINELLGNVLQCLHSVSNSQS